MQRTEHMPKIFTMYWWASSVNSCASWRKSSRWASCSCNMIRYVRVSQMTDSIECFDGHMAITRRPPKNTTLHFTKLPFTDLWFYCDLQEHQMSICSSSTDMPECEWVHSSWPEWRLIDLRYAALMWIFLSQMIKPGLPSQQSNRPFRLLKPALTTHRYWLNIKARCIYKQQEITIIGGDLLLVCLPEWQQSSIHRPTRLLALVRIVLRRVSWGGWDSAKSTNTFSYLKTALGVNGYDFYVGVVGWHNRTSTDCIEWAECNSLLMTWALVHDYIVESTWIGWRFDSMSKPSLGITRKVMAIRWWLENQQSMFYVVQAPANVHGNM